VEGRRNKTVATFYGVSRNSKVSILCCTRSQCLVGVPCFFSASEYENILFHFTIKIIKDFEQVARQLGKELGDVGQQHR